MLGCLHCEKQSAQEQGNHHAIAPHVRCDPKVKAGNDEQRGGRSQNGLLERCQDEKFLASITSPLYIW